VGGGFPGSGELRAVSRAIVGALAALVPAAGHGVEARVIVRTYPATLAPTAVDPAPELATPVVALPTDGRPVAPSTGPKRYRAEPMTGTTVAAPAALLAPPPMIAAPVVATAVVARPSASARIYRVVKGGRLADVATKTGVALDDLVRLNPSISPADRLSAGMIVVLP